MEQPNIDLTSRDSSTGWRCTAGISGRHRIDFGGLLVVRDSILCGKLESMEK